MGNATKTLKKVQIVYVDQKNNLIGIKGAIPGPSKGLVIIKPPRA
jgi:large subunit ribosomal protein L3